MNQEMQDRKTLRSQSAARLFEALRGEAANSIARLEFMSEQLQTRNPEQAERVDLLIGQAIERARMMPEAVTALYLVNTQERRQIIDAEVVGVKSDEGRPGEVDESELEDGRH